MGCLGADERTISIQGVVPNEITNGMYEMELFVQDSIGNEAVGRYQFQVDRTSPDLILMLKKTVHLSQGINQPGYALFDLMLGWNADAVPSTLLVTLADENQIFAFDTTVSGQDYCSSMNGTHGSGEPDGGGQDDVGNHRAVMSGVNLTSGFYKVSSGTPQLITLQDGEYVVQAAIQDAAGNTTTVQKSIVVDTQPPHFRVINGRALQCYCF